MATVRELITKIVFRVDQQGLNRAQRGADNLLRTLRRIGQLSPRVNIQANTTQAQLRLQRLRQQLQQMQNHTIRINTQGSVPRGGAGAGAGAGAGGAGNGFMGALGFGGMSAGAIAAGALATGVAAAGAAAVSATKQYASFDATMSKVKALTNATDADMSRLTKTAEHLGATTQFSATQSAEAMTYLGMAGWKTEEIIKGMPGLLSLAAASGTDLATTADIVSDDLTAFHMSADKAAHMADVMAVASTNANTNVNLMGMTFKYAGAVAGSLGYTLEDVAIATGLMANAGIKGEMAGTALRSTMTRMIDPPKDAAAALAKLGVSAKNADGSVKPFRQQINELRKSFAKLSKAEQAEKASSIAGLEAMSGFLAVVTASDKDFNKLANAIDHADGAAAKSAATMNDNLIGSMTALGSATEAVALKFGKVFEPAVRKAVNKAKEEMAGLSAGMDIFAELNAGPQQKKYDKEPATAEEEIQRTIEAEEAYNEYQTKATENPGTAKAVQIWKDICKWIDNAGKWIDGKLTPVLERLNTYWEKYLWSGFNTFKNNMESGLESLGNAWKNLGPFIEAISPYLQALVEHIGVLLIAALWVLSSVGSTVFKTLCAVVEEFCKWLGWAGEKVQELQRWIKSLLDDVADALIQLGLLEKKIDGMNMTSKFSWDPFTGSTNVSNTVNVGSVNVPTASDVGKGIGSVVKSEPTYFSYGGAT